MWYPPKYHRTMQKSGLRMVCGVPHTPTHTVRHGSLHSDPTKLDMGPRTSIPPSHGWLQWVARLGHRAGRDSLPASLVAFQLGTAAADRPGAALPGRPWVPPLQSLLGAPPLTTPTPSNLQPSPPPCFPCLSPSWPSWWTTSVKPRSPVRRLARYAAEHVYCLIVLDEAEMSQESFPRSSNVVCCFFVCLCVRLLKRKLIWFVHLLAVWIFSATLVA